MNSPRMLKSEPTQPAFHFHPADSVCPVCDQPIPDERLDEVSGRMRAWEDEKINEVTTRLQERFDREVATAIAGVQAEAAALLKKEREENDSKIIAARDAARDAAELQASEKLAAIQGAAQTEKNALLDKVSAAEAAKAGADAKLAAVGNQLAEVRTERDATVARLAREAMEREASIRKEAEIAATASAREQIDGLAAGKAEAEAKALAAEQQVSALKTSHEDDLAHRLAEQREALEHARVAAVNAEKSVAFEEKMKLSAKVDELQRAVDKQTAEELGEGAEIDLFEALKAEFEGDRIERVNKGQPGADILHTVIHNGRECGRIIYDSKNHAAWRTDFVTKLAADQMAAKAEHAVLSTRKFPAGIRHLHVQDGVLLASPSRVVALTMIVRQHLVQTHTLRLSNEERAEKTAALYAFMTSERCADLFSRIDTHTDDLLEIQVKEKKAHEATWRKQGELIRAVQKVRAELGNEIDTIVSEATPGAPA